MTYAIGPVHPFPHEVDGNKDGAFYERPVNDGAASLYVIIRPRRFMTENDVERLKQGQFTIEELHPDVKQLGRPPRADALWLYKVESFEVAREHHEDSETFNDNAKNYKSAVFDNFDEAMNYCERTFQVSAADFKKSWATSYPQF